MSVPRLSSTLLPPDLSIPYNLSAFDADRFAQLKQGVVGTSQFAQDLWVDAALGSMRGGFVVESGAYDGEKFSNSLLFEVGRGWRCLLVEANPALQMQIEGVHRRCHLLKGGLSTSAQEVTADFVMGGAVGGLASSVDTKKIIDTQMRYKENMAQGVVRVPLYPLHRVLAHIGHQEKKEQLQTARPRRSAAAFTVDFWSLDTEGSEPAILNATDFDAVEVGMLVVEHAGSATQRAAVLSVLVGRLGFARVSCHDTDDYYANPAYFAARGMQLPSSDIKVHVLASERRRTPELARGRYRHAKCKPS